MAQAVPDKTQLRRYLDEGLTQAQIAQRWESDSGVKVSRSAIGMAIARYGLESSRPRPRFTDLLPWRLAPEHAMDYTARMLRLEGRRRQGLAMNDEELQNLESFLAKLNAQGEVIDYHPSVGFVFLKRRADEKDLVRSPEDVGGTN